MAVIQFKVFSWLIGEVGRVVGEVWRVAEVVGKVGQRRSCFTYKNVVLEKCWTFVGEIKVQQKSNTSPTSPTSPTLLQWTGSSRAELYKNVFQCWTNVSPTRGVRKVS